MPHSRRMRAFFDFRDKGLGWIRVGLYIFSFCKSEGIC